MGRTIPIDLERCGMGSGKSETLRQALDLALDGLRPIDRGGPICEIVAHKVVEVGLNGIRNPQEIAALTIKQFGGFAIYRSDNFVSEMARQKALAIEALAEARRTLKQGLPDTFLGRQHYDMIPLPYERE
jgi:hypothetical protein